MAKRSGRVVCMCLALLLAFVFYPTKATAHGGGAHSHEADATANASAHSTAEPTLADIRDEVATLRRQLAGYEQTTRIRDVLGGLGYLAGIAGAAFYFLGRRVAVTKS
jgi:hypothetical protein